MLLGALVGERHHRRVLLAELAAELAAIGACAEAAAAATALSSAAEGLGAGEFEDAIHGVARLLPPTLRSAGTS
jgi:hypothetical protein